MSLLRKATQALEQNSERPAESKRLGAAHGAPDPIPVPLALAHRSIVAARYNAPRNPRGWPARAVRKHGS